MEFDLKELAKEKLIMVAHRGIWGGNIPCNTIAAYEIALKQGADMIEVDVDASADGQLFIFHPAMETAHLNQQVSIPKLPASEVRKLRYVNVDDTKTQFGLETLDDVLENFKGRCYINIDKFCNNPVEIAKAYDQAGADELVFLDITASSDNRNTVVDMVRKVAECVFIPFTVGGGIRTVEDFRALLREGADKISINSSAINTPELVHDAAEKFGSQCVVVAIDAKRRTDGSGWNIYKNGGRIDVGLDAVEWAKKVESLGAGEILLTSMDCDGTKAGYDNELTAQIAENVSVPVIASGGAGEMAHFYDALTVGRADAALAASLFHYKELEIMELKRYLAGRGLSIRL